MLPPGSEPTGSSSALLGLLLVREHHGSLAVVVGLAADEHQACRSVHPEQVSDGTVGAPELHTGHLEAAAPQDDPVTLAELSPVVGHAGSTAPGMPGVHGGTAAIARRIPESPRVERVPQFVSDVRHAVPDPDLLDLGVHPDRWDLDIRRPGGRHPLSPEAQGGSDHCDRQEAADHAAVRSAPVSGVFSGGFGQASLSRWKVHVDLPLST